MCGSISFSFYVVEFWLLGVGDISGIFVTIVESIGKIENIKNKV